jgi:hypothetical protein
MNVQGCNLLGARWVWWAVILVAVSVTCIASESASAPRIEKDSNSQFNGAHSGPARNPLYMDVEWVMQGWGFGFQGFYVEFLGYMDGLHALLPNTRIVQSSFRKTFTDPPVKNYTQFYEVVYAQAVCLCMCVILAEGSYWRIQVDMLEGEGNMAHWFEVQ